MRETLQPDVDCPIAGPCGGCALIDRGPELQLRLKRQQVRDAFDEYPGLRELAVEPCRPATVRHGYRNRAKLAVREIDGRVVAGLFGRGGDRIVDLAPCRVQRPQLLERMRLVTEWLARRRLARPNGPVKYVDLRETADGGWHLTLVVEQADLPETGGWAVTDLERDGPGLVGVSVNLNPHDSSFVFGPTTRTVWGRRGFDLPVEGPDGRTRRFEVPATGFFQLATEPLAFVHREMHRHLGAHGELIDLYCGVGVHGLTLASLGGGAEAPMIGVEEHIAAAACARRNADRLGVRAQIHAGRVERLAAELPAASRVVLNPGRAGCRPAVLDSLRPGPGRRLAYLSCAPRTLARDLARLVAAGWGLASAVPLDLLPQTDHVETLVLLDGGL